MSPVAVVGSPASAANGLLVAAWRALGVPARVLTGGEACASLADGEIALGRVDVLPTLDGVEPGLLALLLLERAGANVRNRALSLLSTHDKLRTAARLAAAGLPHPPTGHVRTPRDPLPVSPPLVLKPRFGSWGADVARACSEPEARRLLEAVAERPWFRRHGALVQELVPAEGRDLRVLVAGGRVVGAVERTAASGDWRTNVSLGGTRAPAAPDGSARALALAAAAAVDADLVGVDLLPLPGGGHVVIELNGAVDFDAAYSLPGSDVYRDTATALRLVAGRAAAA